MSQRQTLLESIATITADYHFKPTPDHVEKWVQTSMTQDQTRTYTRDQSIIFRKTAEAFGGLSNMAPGYQLRVNGIRILTSEALYQACRFPHLPEVQRMILNEYSPMTAKMKSKPFRSDSRAD